MQLFCPAGIYCIPNNQNIKSKNNNINKKLGWEGVIFLKDGIYKNGVYKFYIEIPLNYPEICPKIFFTTKVFNPRIDYETGELDLKVNIS